MYTLYNIIVILCVDVEKDLLNVPTPQYRDMRL